jgi:general secretion pathway protein I
MRKPRGFTLLEVIIALAIMTMAFAAILSMISDGINASARTHKMTIVSMLAKRQMVEVEYKYEGKTFDEVKKEDGGTFPTPYEEYRWTYEIKEIEFPNLGGGNSSSGGAASDTDSNSSEIADMMTKLVTQFLSKAIRQVSVTIFWKNGTKEQNFAVATYWVDLNHEFQLTQ